MTRSVHCAYTIKMCLLVGCLFQVGGGRAVPNEHTLSVRATSESDPSSAVTGTSNDVNGAAQSYGDGVTSLLRNAGTTVMEFGSESSKSVEEAIKAGGRATLAIGSLCTQLYNGLSSTVTSGMDYTAGGLNGVHGYLGSLPVLGVLTGGLSQVTSGLTDTINDMSTSGREARSKLIQTLLDQLNLRGTASGDSTATGTGTA